eukprot:5859184-Heterocapsa_arctica.AAC.1
MLIHFLSLDIVSYPKILKGEVLECAPPGGISVKLHSCHSLFQPLLHSSCSYSDQTDSLHRSRAGSH